MDFSFFKNKKITVFGLGLLGGGVGVVKFLSRHGARVIVTDIKNKEQLAPSLGELDGTKNVEFVLGQHRREDFENVDMVIKNPAIPWTNEHIRLAISKGIPVEMDSSLFFKMCKNPIIGITGTKGKTTTASLIFEVLKTAGKKAVKAGIGQTPVLDKLDLLEKDSVVVFELSSWRLSALGRAKLSPRVAVMTNLFVDHQNYYKNMEEYLTDKENIFLFQKPQDYLIINGDNALLAGSAAKSKAQIMRFSMSPAKEGKSVFLDEGAIYINDGVDIKKLMDIKDIKIPGRHNIENVLAAAGAAYVFGIPINLIASGVQKFKGVPHRLEFVRELAGARYYNDTAATIPDAMIEALNSFSAPIVLIAGGTDKKLDFSLAGKVLAQKLDSFDSNRENQLRDIIFLKGDATNKLLGEIRRNLTTEEKDKDFAIVDSMEVAVEAARKLARTGDIVLLSPGAASFGLFLNEFDRGDKFCDVVRKL